MNWIAYFGTFSKEKGLTNIFYTETIHFIHIVIFPQQYFTIKLLL